MGGNLAVEDLVTHSVGLVARLEASDETTYVRKAVKQSLGKLPPKMLARHDAALAARLKVLLDLDKPKRVEVLLPYSADELHGEVHKVGAIESEEFEERGMRIVAHVRPSLFNRLAPYVEGKSAKKAPPPPAGMGGEGACNCGGEGCVKRAVADGGAASSTIHAAALNALEFSMVQSSVESLRQLLDDLKQQVSDHPWKMTKGELGVAVGDKVREGMTSGGDTIMDELSAPEVLDEMKARLAEMEKITGSKPERDDDVISQMEVMLNGAGMASEDGDMASSRGASRGTPQGTLQ